MVTKAQVSRYDLDQQGIGQPGTVFDQRRTRTAWFEGQHVTAEHFNRDQSYHITRQADLGRTIGQGVVEGLGVELLADGQRLKIKAGMGLAPSGELLVLAQEVEIDLADVGGMRSFNGLISDDPYMPPPETRTGLFVLAISPIEYTSNPVGSYPASINTARTLEDSVINEAVVFTLSPFPAGTVGPDTQVWRANAAKSIFGDEADPQLPPSALALAMIALVGRRIQWVDVPMVRRHCAPASGDIFGLGMVDQTRRIAHFEQFDAMIAAQIAANPGVAAPASDLVRILPPMGRMPVGSVALRAGPGEPDRLSQNWFPSVMPVELVALPHDEIEALLRESIHLPPIDLSAPEAVLANTPITVIVPVARSQWATTPAEVAEATFTLVPPPAVGGSSTDPATLLRALISGEPAPAASEMLLTGAWRMLLGQADQLWYARRRQFQRSDMIVAGAQDVVLDTGILLPPIPPLISDAEAGEMAEALMPVVKAVFQSHGLDNLFEKQLSLTAPVPLRLLQRQTQLIGLGAPALAMSLAFAVVAREESFERAIKAHSIDGARAYMRCEPVLIGTGFALQILLKPHNDPQTVLRFIESAVGADPRGLESMVDNLSGMTISLPKGENPDDMALIFDTALSLGVHVTPVSQDVDSDEAKKIRVALAACGALPRLSAALTRLVPENEAKANSGLRDAVRQAGNESELRDALIKMTERIAR